MISSPVVLLRSQRALPFGRRVPWFSRHASIQNPGRILVLILVVAFAGCEYHCPDEQARVTPSPTPSSTASTKSEGEPHASIKLVADIATVVIALCALGITLWQGYHTRLHNRLTVKPLLVFGRYHENETNKPMGLHIVNSGLGPAIITSTTLRSKSRNSILRSIPEITQLIRDWGIVAGETIFLIHAPGDVISAGKTSRYVVLNSTPAQARAELFNEFLNDIDIVICYKSIYGERFSCSSSKQTGGG